MWLIGSASRLQRPTCHAEFIVPDSSSIAIATGARGGQALDRTQPGLPIKKGRAGTMTHEYKRHSVTTLFAALNVLEGQGPRPMLEA
jgi:hypothetical protein